MNVDDSLSRQKLRIISRTGFVGLLAFLSAWRQNPGEPGLSATYNSIAFPLMAVVCALAFLYAAFVAKKTVFIARAFAAALGIYFVSSLAFALFLLPPEQNINSQLVPLLPYISVFVAIVYVFLEAPLTHWIAGFYTLIGVLSLGIYRFQSRGARIPTIIEAAFGQQFIIVNTALIGLFFVFERIRRSYLESSEATRVMEEVAFTDELTGIHNRRFAEQVLAREFPRFLASPAQPYWLAILDVDHFKQINDRFGHQTGDRVLKAFARELQSSIRDSDWVARWGGEEFILLLVNVGDIASLTPTLERIRKAVEQHRDVNLPPFTASIGASPVLESDGTWTDAIKRADEALYLAKKNGRNRSEYFPVQSPTMSR